jgi:hypothetical protein
MMAATRRGEQGKGTINSIIGLAVFILAMYSVWHVAPLFITDYSFKDKLNEIARSNRGQYSDERLKEMIMKEIRERQLDDYISGEMIKIHTVETSRRIYVEYDRKTTPLPGWEKTFHFVDDVDQPLIF